MKNSSHSSGPRCLHRPGRALVAAGRRDHLGGPPRAVGGMSGRELVAHEVTVVRRTAVARDTRNRRRVPASACEVPADLPLVAERVNDAADPPAVLVGDR